VAENDLLQAALEYVRRGWSVVPAHGIDADGICTCTRHACEAPGKHPRLSWAPYQQERANEALVRQWWKRWPEANIAIVTGSVSGVVVLDIDPRHGGKDSLAELGQLPPTVTCLTGGGGEHLFYTHPGRTVKNGANLLPGIDLRGDGGYVIAAPSRHASGQRYQWEGGYSPAEAELSDMPPCVEALLNGYRPAVNAPEESSEIDIMALLQGKQRIAEGERNVQMTRIAGHLLGKSDDVPTVLGTMMSINIMACQPALDITELQTIIRSIHGRQERKREALRLIQERSVTSERASMMGNAERLELARAAWAQLDVPDVVDWLRVVSADGIEYQLELPDRVASLGDALLSGYGRIRDAVLNATGCLMPNLKRNDWEPYAQQLVRFVREEVIGSLRQSDQIAEWLEHFAKLAQAYPVEARSDALRSQPILYEGRVATRMRRWLTFLEAQYAERYTPAQMAKRLRMSGWTYGPIRAGDSMEKVWLSPPLTAEEVPPTE
jgi:hypothetical protein